jgi:hypothetical protein
MSIGGGCRPIVQATILALAVLVAGFGEVWAAVQFLGLTFPDRVADTKVGQTHDFEAANPGLGYSVRYDKPGWAIDVYVYALQMSSIPDDVNSELLKAQLTQAQGDIFEQEKKGTYAQVKVVGSRVIKDSRGQARFTCKDFSYIRQDLGNVDSYLCLTGWNNKFVKFRLTTTHDPKSAAEANRFVRAWIPLLWP